MVCGRTPSDAHHIKFAEQRAMGLGQRQVHRSDLPAAPSRAAPARRRARVVADAKDRSASDCDNSLGEDACGCPLQQRVLATWIAPPRSTTDAMLQTDPAPRSDTKMTKRSQFVARRPDELVPVNRGQPPQCASEHRSCHRSGQEKVAAKCASSWTDGRNRGRRAGRCGGLCGLRNGRDRRL
jgi:hypothetical protein